MNRFPLKRGAVAGLIAAAATIGVLIGFGRARGTTMRPVNAIAHVVLGSRAFLFDHPDPLVTMVALLVHVASLLAWGVLFAIVAGRLRGWMLFAAAFLFAAFALAIDYVVVPLRLRPGFEETLSRGEIGITYAVLAIAIAAGLNLSRRSVDIS